MAERIGIFIDGGYLNKLVDRYAKEGSLPTTVAPDGSVRARKVDFTRLCTKITGSDDLMRSYYYNAPPYRSKQPTPEQVERLTKADNFYKALQSIPRFEVRLGKVAYRGEDRDGKPIYMQKGVDGLICVDLLTLSFKRMIAKACLLAGDSDFVPAIRTAKNEGVVFSLWHGPHGGENSTVDRELWDLCDDRVELTPGWLQDVLR